MTGDAHQKPTVPSVSGWGLLLLGCLLAWWLVTGDAAFASWIPQGAVLLVGAGAIYLWQRGRPDRCGTRGPGLVLFAMVNACGLFEWLVLHRESARIATQSFAPVLAVFAVLHFVDRIRARGRRRMQAQARAQ